MQKALKPWASLEGQAREELDRSPLTLAICQVSFPTKLKATTDEVAGKFQDKIDNRYPILNKIGSQGWELSASIGQGAQARDLPPRITLQFADPQYDWVVGLSTDSISLECRSYPNFDEFLVRLREIIEACIETVRPTIVSRIGLRYINEIRVASLPDAQRVIRRELLGPAAIAPFADATRNVVQSMELSADGDTRINFNHGYFPSGTSVQPRPNSQSPAGAFYLLDLDVYRVFAGNYQVAMNAEGVVSCAEGFHDTLSRIFWWSVTDTFVSQAKGS